MALKVGELFASFNLDTSGIDSAVSSAEKSLSSLGKGLTLGGAAMTAAITAPVIGAFKDIYSKGSEFNSQMSKVFAIRGLDSTLAADVETMEQLNAKALEMGSTTKFTASEAGQAFEYMAMAGWDTASMLGGIGPILNLAAAAGEDLGTTSDIVTDAMTSFGYTIDKVGGDTGKFTEMTTHFTDVLAAASSNANTNVSMLGESFKYVGSIAGSLGYSIEDTAVALGIMANSGIKSSQAGTSLRTIMTRLNGDIKISGKNMKEVTVRTANADGSMRDFSEIIADCREAFKGLTESEKAQMAESLVGRNAMSGFLTLMNATDEEIASLTSAINNCDGATERMAATMLDNVGGSVTLFKSAVEGLEITLWELVKGPVKDMIDRATGIVDAFRKMDSATQMGAMKMAGFAAAIGPVMTASGTLLMMLPKIAKGIALLSSPLGVVGLGFAAFTAAAMDSNNQIGQTFEKMGKGVKKALTGVNKQLNKFLSWNSKTGKSVIGSRMIAFSESITTGLKDIIPAGMATVTLFLRSLMTGISESASSLAGIGKTVITELLNGITKGLPMLVPLAAKMISNIAVALISNAPEILSAGITLFTTLIKSLNEVNWTEIGTKINEAVKTALSEIKTNLFTLVFGEEPKEGDLGDWGKFGSKVVEKIKGGITTASQNGKNLLGGLVLGDDYNPDDSWGTVAGKIWNKITTAMGSFLSGAGDLIKGLALGEDYTADASWGDVATAIWNKIKAAFTTLKANAKDLLGTIALGEGYTADTTWETVGQAIWDKIKAKFSSLSTNAKEIIGTLVLGEGYTADTSWETIATAIWEKIKTKFSALAAGAKDIVGELVLGEGYTADSSWGEIGQAIWDTAKTKFAELAADAKNIIGQLVLGEGYTADTSWGDIGQAIWNKAKEKFDTLAKSAKDLVGTLVLGSDYTADTTWENVGKAVWDKAKAGFDALAASAKDLVGQLVLGDDYTADTSWSTIGSAVWDAAKSGFDTLAATAKDFVGKLVLGDDYKADTSWATIGTAVWNAAKSGFDTLTATAKDFVGTLVLGDDYNADTSWSKIGERIWEKAKSGFSTLAATAKDIIGDLVLGDDYDPGDSWQTIGSAIWEKAKTGFSNAFTAAKDIIGTFVLGDDYDPGDTWKTIGSAIWEKAKAGFAEAFTLAKEVIGTFVLGDDYDPGDSWKKIGAAIWDKAKEGFSSAFTAAKDIIGTFVLGDDYEPGDSWKKIGSGIWAKAQEGFNGAYKTAKDIIGTFALGDDYTADESWAKIGQALWDKIKEKLTALSANAKDLIGNLVYSGGEEGYTADESWAYIGKKLWEKVQSGITAGKDMAAAILEKIGNVEIDVEGVMTTVKNAGTFVSNLVGNMLNGRITWGTKITDLAKKIGDKFAAYGWDNIGTTLGQVANNLITAITDAIPNAVDAAGNAIDVGLTLASGIMNSIVTAIGDSSLASGFSNLVQGLVTGIVAAVERLPEMLGNVLSAGAQIANAIMGSITSALTDMEASGIAASLGQAAVDLVKGLLSSVGDLSKNTDVQSFMQNLGEGLRSALGMLGDICGEIIGWIFSTEGLKSIYNAGVTVANLLKQGIDAALSGSLNFFEHLFEGVLVNLGLVNEDDLAAAKESGKLLADTITESAESELADTAQGRTLIDLMNWGLMNGSENKGWVDTSDMQAAINWAFERSEGSAELFREKFIDKFLDTKGGAVGPAGDKEFWANILGVENLGKTFTELVEEAVEESPDYEGSFSNWTDYLKYLVSKGKLNPSDFITDDMNFWQAFYDAYANNDTTAMMNLLASQGKEMFGEAAEATKEAAEGAAEDAAQEAAEAAQKALAGSYEQAAADTEDTIANAMEQAGVNGVKGFTFGTKETAGEAEGAALQVSDDVVKTFLLTMSQENGYLIGENFVLSMGTAMSDKTADMSAIALAAGQVAYSALSGSASYVNGYTIGYNFGSGFVAGIESMIDRAASAAASLGAAGTDSLSGIIREGSPSRVTAETGVNFGLGFINSILDSAEGAADAAAMMGRSAGDALAYTVRGIGSEAAEIRYPQAGGYARGEEAYYSGQQNDPAIEQMTNRIIEALSHMGVYIDGEPAGHVLTPYISEEIAHSTSVRR